MFIISIANEMISGLYTLKLEMFLSVDLIMFGLIFCILGLMGQYIGRIFDESKNRPLYIVESKINYKKDDKSYAIGS